ncbi:hypothetical protein Q7P35_011714 [Cladosporium inversicolor]
MRFSYITAFATLAFAAEGLSSPNTSPDLRARTIGGACKHSGTPGTCQKTSTCANDLGWYSNGDCPNDPSNVKCCMFTECRKDGVFGHCMNKAGNACSGGKWFKNLCPGDSTVQCCIT